VVVVVDVSVVVVVVDVFVVVWIFGLSQEWKLLASTNEVIEVSSKDPVIFVILKSLVADL
jgi:hypothetical protein